MYIKYLQLCSEPLPTSVSNLSTKEHDGATVSKQRQFLGASL